MNRSVVVRNRRRGCRVNLPLLRRIARALMDELWPGETIALGVHLLGDGQMTRLNEAYLRHQGTTDVITFDYAEADPRGSVCAEVFICLDEARRQARRFGTTWQRELTRYLVHGALHLRGYDDRPSSRRRSMKRVENRLLRRLAARFALRGLEQSRPRA